MNGMNVTALSDRQLLARLVGEHAAGRYYQGSLKPLFADSGNHVHRKCAAARELVRRYLGEEMQCRCVLSAPGTVRDFLRIHFANQEHESFIALWLDAQNRLIAAEELFRGTLTQTSVYPREVVKAALRANAGAVIFSHNHPSGVAEPSRADELLTGNLKQALALVDVKILDHFVVAGSATISFAERGLL
ncbi:MAG: DNA repair protein RadC [Sulfuritalea sp.]|nr:DNA repair protein RadC [Sulfuritalea sp.]